MRFPSIVLASLLCASVSACGSDDASEITASSPADEIAEGLIGELSSIADTLEGLDADSTAEEAAPSLKEAIAQLETMSKAIDGELTGFKAMRVLGSRMGEFMEVQGRIASSMARLSEENPDLMRQLGKELDSLRPSAKES